MNIDRNLVSRAYEAVDEMARTTKPHLAELRKDLGSALDADARQLPQSTSILGQIAEAEHALAVSHDAARAADADTKPDFSHGSIYPNINRTPTEADCNVAAIIPTHILPSTTALLRDSVVDYDAMAARLDRERR